MHLNFDFSAVQIFWIMTFAALLVLLVVLFGRDRVRRYPWFTASMIVMAFRLVATRLLYNRLPMVASSMVFLVLADVAAIISMLVVVELARQAFAGVKRISRVTAALVLLAVGATVLALWTPWPSPETLFASSTLATLRLMQLAAQKFDLLANLLFIQLGVLVVLFGRRYHAGWRSHTQQIVIGYSTSAIGQLAVSTIWQIIALHTMIQQQSDYVRVMGLEEKFANANNLLFVFVLIWWIACLWIDEPGTQSTMVVATSGVAEIASGTVPEILPAVEDKPENPEN
jgi:hypothetical protein